MPTWLTAVLSIITNLVPLVPQIISAWNQPTNTLGKIQAVVKNTAAEQELQNIGAALFPKLAPAFQAAAAALQIAHPTAIQYVQASLNVLGAAGVFPLPNNEQLAEDGIWGPKTTAAAEAAEKAAGITLTGAINDDLVNWVGGALAKLG